MANTAEAMVNEAVKHDGYLETPVNRTKFGEAYGWNGVAWCHIYLSVCARWSGNGDIVPWTAGCAYGWDWFSDRGQFFRRGAKLPRKGDIVYYGSSGGDHVGLVVSVSGGNIHTIEGNTSKSSGFNPNGGGVHRKTWPLNYSRIYGHGRPAYKSVGNEENDMPDLYVSLGSEKWRGNLKAGEWCNLAWDHESSDSGKQHVNPGAYPTVLTTSSRYVATVLVAIDGMKEGDAGWVRAAEAEKTSTGNFHYPEFSTTNTVCGRKDGKTVWHTMCWNDWLGKNRRLRIQAGGFTCPVTVTPYSCKIHGWRG